MLTYNYMVLAVTFRVKNNIFAEQLRTMIQDNETTQVILKKMSLEDIEEFTQKEKFLLF